MSDIRLRALCFLASTPSILALMAGLYGLAPMGPVVLGLALPGALLLVAIYRWATGSGRSDLAIDLLLGFWGGLLGTFAYDLFRVPFHLAGLRVFSTISAFGIWILDASAATRFTELVGWSYHFLNGIMFGIMYALFMRGRPWPWAVAWGVSLELMAVVSPFGDVFALRGNPSGLAIAFAGHVAYGIPLGLVVWRWQAAREWLAQPPAFSLFAAMVGAAALASPLWDPASRAWDQRQEAGAFRVEGRRLNPTWLRVKRGDSVRFTNPESQKVTIRIRPSNQVLEVSGGSSLTFKPDRGGIHQVFVQTDRRSVSSFLMVDPIR